jgi:hypothetical protein
LTEGEFSVRFNASRFPTYDPIKLHWNESKTLNEEGKYCYCGQDRYVDIFMLQCNYCKNWFHEGCVSAELGNTIPFFTNYIFACGACSPGGMELFQRAQCAWKDVATTAMANLMMLEIRKRYTDVSAKSLMQQDIEPCFFIRDEVIEFVDDNWLALWGQNKAKVDHIWKGTLSTYVISRSSVVFDMFFNSFVVLFAVLQLPKSNEDSVYLELFINIVRCLWPKETPE